MEGSHTVTVVGGALFYKECDLCLERVARCDSGVRYDHRILNRHSDIMRIEGPEKKHGMLV